MGKREAFKVATNRHMLNQCIGEALAKQDNTCRSIKDSRLAGDSERAHTLNKRIQPALGLGFYEICM